jgi:hypothetical protein
MTITKVINDLMDDRATRKSPTSKRLSNSENEN